MGTKGGSGVFIKTVNFERDTGPHLFSTAERTKTTGEMEYILTSILQINKFLKYEQIKLQNVGHFRKVL